MHEVNVDNFVILQNKNKIIRRNMDYSGLLPSHYEKIASPPPCYLSALRKVGV